MDDLRTSAREVDGIIFDKKSDGSQKNCKIVTEQKG